MSLRDLRTRVRLPRWKQLYDRLRTVALALFLALIVWLVAINQENPLVRDTFQGEIPIAVRGLPETLTPLQNLNSETVRVVIQSPRSSWENLDVDDFTAYIDLAGLDAGVHDVDVIVDVVDPSVEIVDVLRPQLRMQLDPVVEKIYPVRAQIMDNAAPSYERQDPIIEPISVTVRGPATQIDQVANVDAEVYLLNAKSQVERTLTLTPHDSQGQVVTRLTIEPQQARIVVPIEQLPGRKEVAVRVNLQGQPPAGYRLSTVRVNPTTAVLLGRANVLAEVPGFVETEPISLENATGDQQFRVNLVLPENVTSLDGDIVSVTVTVTPIEGGTTVKQVPIIQGLGNGLEASVDLDVVDVILSGPVPLLDSLGPDDIFVILDLDGLLAGNHIVTPRVVLPDGIRSEGVLPETVEVVVTATQETLEPDGESVPTAESTPGTGTE